MRSSRLTIEMLEGVVSLLRNKTFERAGKELGISSSALHKRIDHLNDIFGVELFKSTKSGMVLIEQAESLAQDSVRIIEYALLAEQRTIASVSPLAGRVRVGHSTYLPPKLLAVVTRIISDRSSGMTIESKGDLTLRIRQQVVEGDLDVGIGFLPVDHPDLLVHVLAHDPVVVCMPPGHRLTPQSSIDPRDLEEEAIIAVSRYSFPAAHEEIGSFFGDLGIALKIRHDAFGPPEALTLVQQGQGVCMVGSSSIGAHNVVARPLSPNVLTRRSGLFMRQDSANANALLFVDLLLRRSGRRPRSQPPDKSSAGDLL